MSTITHEQIKSLTTLVETRSAHVDYESTIPLHVQSKINDCVVQYWKDNVVECEPSYIEMEDMEVLAHLEEDEVLEALMESNKGTEYDPMWVHYTVGDSYGRTFTFADMEEAYVRTIVSDVSSAWESLYRDVFEEVCGFDPANEEIAWPED